MNLFAMIQCEILTLTAKQTNDDDKLMINLSNNDAQLDTEYKRTSHIMQAYNYG